MKWHLTHVVRLTPPNRQIESTKFILLLCQTLNLPLASVLLTCNLPFFSKLLLSFVSGLSTIIFLLVFHSLFQLTGTNVRRTVLLTPLSPLMSVDSRLKFFKFQIHFVLKLVRFDYHVWRVHYLLEYLSDPVPHLRHLTSDLGRRSRLGYMGGPTH